MEQRRVRPDRWSVNAGLPSPCPRFHRLRSVDHYPLAWLASFGWMGRERISGHEGGLFMNPEASLPWATKGDLDFCLCYIASSRLQRWAVLRLLRSTPLHLKSSQVAICLNHHHLLTWLIGCQSVEQISFIHILGYPSIPLGMQKDPRSIHGIFSSGFSCGRWCERSCRVVASLMDQMVGFSVGQLHMFIS